MILQFLHWNILFREKIENVLDLLQKIKPDVFCLNELSLGLEFNNGIDTEKFIAQKLGYGYFSKAYMDMKGDGKKLVSSGIFTRYKIVKKKVAYTKNITFDKEYGFTKGTTYIEITVNINNDRLTFATDHLSYVTGQKESEEKIKETDELIKIIKNKKEKYIFSGDLNVPPNSYTIKQISKYLHSCGPDYKEKTAFTRELIDYAGWKTGFEWRLDHVFATRDLEVKTAQIVKTPYSDHLPILVEFEI